MARKKPISWTAYRRADGKARVAHIPQGRLHEPIKRTRRLSVRHDQRVPALELRKSQTYNNKTHHSQRHGEGQAKRHLLDKENYPLQPNSKKCGLCSAANKVYYHARPEPAHNNSAAVVQYQKLCCTRFCAVPEYSSKFTFTSGE